MSNCLDQNPIIPKFSIVLRKKLISWGVYTFCNMSAELEKSWTKRQNVCGVGTSTELDVCIERLLGCLKPES